jgi:hypothetical protein
MITASLYAAPLALVLSNPVWLYNFAVAASLLAAFLAMYLLVRSWTGLASAGIAAGLLYAFHATRVEHIFHFAVWDTTWTVFAIYFAERLFVRGRWRDALGLGASCALQIGTSFYPLMVATGLALPFVPWLVAAHGIRRVTPLQLATVAVMVLAAAFWVLGPFIAGGIERPASYAHFFYADWRDYWPGRIYSPGWILVILAGFGLVSGRWGMKLPRDPRWALLTGALLLAFLSVGPDTARIFGSLLGADGGNGRVGEPWNPYMALGEVLPGLRSVRGIVRLSAGVTLVACVLAGFGFAAAVRRVRQRSRPLSQALSVCLVGMAFAAVAHPALPGLEPRYRLAAIEVRVSPAEIEFFRDLERMGNRGPIFEVPVATGLDVLRTPQQRILRSFFHRRRVATCFGSYMPGAKRQLELSSELPAPEALRALADDGFTTIVVEGRKDRARFLRTARQGTQGIRLLHATPERVAFEILPSDQR